MGVAEALPCAGQPCRPGILQPMRQERMATGATDPHTVCDVTVSAWEPAVTGVSGGNNKEKPVMGKPVFTMEGAFHAKERQGESFVARTELAHLRNRK